MKANLRTMRDYALSRRAPRSTRQIDRLPANLLEQMSEGAAGDCGGDCQQTAVVAATGIANIIIANQVVSRAISSSSQS